MSVNNPQEGNYLYYQVLDEKGKVRGNIIGTQHNVKREDRNLNPDIIAAINRSSRAILEMVPGSGLIPPLTSPQFVISEAQRKIKEIKTDAPSNSESLKKQAEDLMKSVEEQIAEEDYLEVEIAFKEIISFEEQLIFAQSVLDNIKEFDSVSLEENLNAIIQSNKKINIENLEDIDLAKLIVEANERIQRSEPLTQTESLSLEEEQARAKEFEETRTKEYESWKNGDESALKVNLDKVFSLFNEHPEHDAIHRFRDEKIASRVVEMLKKTQEEDSETTFVMGCAHLLYSKRKNVLEHLREHFKTDLQGWSIKQFKRDSI